MDFILLAQILKVLNKTLLTLFNEMSEVWNKNLQDNVKFNFTIMSKILTHKTIF